MKLVRPETVSVVNSSKKRVKDIIRWKQLCRKRKKGVPWKPGATEF